MCAFCKVGLSNSFVLHVVMQTLDQGSWHRNYNLPTCADYQAKSVLGCEGINRNFLNGKWNLQCCSVGWRSQSMNGIVKGNMLNTYELLMILRWHYTILRHYGFEYFVNEYIYT